MISGHINQASEYFNLSPGIRLALEYLQRVDHEVSAPGRHDVDGNHVFALVSDYQTRSPEETFWEAHRRHVDVQFVHSGAERIGFGVLDAFELDPYDVDRDLVVARGQSDQFIELGPGEFAILFPQDVHMPGLTGQAVRQVRKIVMKVRL
jgi:biofilm protein TabA